jgi:hypothetical protein
MRARIRRAQKKGATTEERIVRPPESDEAVKSL